MKSLIRRLVLALLRLYYPRIAVEGQENLPQGPVIFVLNHPNGLLDPLLLFATLGRPVSFLAKHTLFGNPLGKLLMDAFGALPVFRRRDAPGQDTAARNEETFARCRALLANGGALALFPEGTTHSGPALLPLKPGAAQIALSAEDAAAWGLNLPIVPIGLWYEDKQLFRSAVLLVVGRPLALAPLRPAYAAEPEAAVATLTAQIADRLGAVLLQASSAELLRGMPFVVRWTIDHLSAKRRGRAADVSHLKAAYASLATLDPETLTSLARAAERYARTLRMLGINDPWSAELPTARRARYLLMGALLVLGAPFAAAGLLISYLPYRVGNFIAPRITHEDQLYGTIKLISGLICVPLGWIIAALIVGFVLTPLAGWLLLGLAPLLGFIALRWSELWQEFRAAFTVSWLRFLRPDLTAQLAARRQALTAEIVAAVTSLDELDAKHA